MGCAKNDAIEQERRRKISEAMKASYVVNNGARRKKLAKHLVSVWKNKAEKKRRVAAMLKTFAKMRAKSDDGKTRSCSNDPIYRKILSDAQKKRWSSSKSRKMQSADEGRLE